MKKMRPALIAILSVCVALCVAVPALAGTLCGTVRNADTLQPVASAGVFLYQGGAYTGLYGATDAGGQYCIEQVPPGTYELSVKVDDYQTAWVTDVVIEDDATAVDLFSGMPAELDAPWPNPSSAQIFFRYRIGRAEPVRLMIYDQRGRLIRGWQGEARIGESTLSWNFRDLAGRPVASGLYYLRMHVGERVLTRQIARIR